MSRTFRNRGNKNPLMIHHNLLSNPVRNCLEDREILEWCIKHYTDNNRTWKETKDKEIFHKLLNKKFRKENRHYVKDIEVIDDIPTPMNKKNLSWLVY